MSTNLNHYGKIGLLNINMVLKFIDNNITQSLYIMIKENTSERDMDLLKAYKESLDQACYPFLLSDVIEATIRKPAKRFYCATRGVYESIKIIRSGRDPSYCSEERKRLVNDVYERVLKLEVKNPDTHLKYLIEEVLDGPAPEFYLKKSSAIVILHHIQKHARYVEMQQNKTKNERMERRKNRKRPLI